MEICAHRTSWILCVRCRRAYCSVSPLFVHMLCGTIGLHLQNTNSKKKLRRILEQWQQSIKPHGTFYAETQCNCTGHMSHAASCASSSKEKSAHTSRCSVGSQQHKELKIHSLQINSRPQAQFLSSPHPAAATRVCSPLQVLSWPPLCSPCSDTPNPHCPGGSEEGETEH